MELESGVGGESKVVAEANSGSPPPAGEERLTPTARLFHSRGFNCHIITVMGSNTSINPEVIKNGLKHTLIRHPRFSSKLTNDGGQKRWVRTKVNVEDHVKVPEVDPEMASPDQFIEDYVSYLTTIPLDLSKPLWELHLLNVKTSEAEAVAVLKIHHSVGDGMSLMSLLLACCTKSSDPQALPTLPQTNRPNDSGNAGLFFWLFLAVWSALRLIWNTVVDLLLFAATLMSLKDTKTPLKGEHGVACNPKKIVHKTIGLDDVKLVKNAMDMTINDVILGVTQAGLSRYLTQKYGEIHKNDRPRGETNDLPRKIRLRATVLVNVRPTAGIQALADMMKEGSKGYWGNKIGYVCVPLDIGLHDDPLDYLHSAKATIDRKKHSLEAICTSVANKLITGLFGTKVSGAIIRRFLSHTTMSFSNMVGPVEEICFYGHSMAYLAPTVYGHPQALTVHFQSYSNKMIIVLAVDPNVISDPHLLCHHLDESLKLIKSAVLQRGLVKENPSI